MIDSLNRRILELGRGAKPSDPAPNTWTELKASGLNDFHVFSGASDDTIYGIPEVNWAFRHWHDRIHLEHGLSFSLEDELIVAELHIQELHDDAHKRIVYADVAEQVKHFYATGEYVKHQRKFVESFL